MASEWGVTPVLSTVGATPTRWAATVTPMVMGSSAMKIHVPSLQVRLVMVISTETALRIPQTIVLRHPTPANGTPMLTG